MDNLFILLFLASIVAFFVGLIKPSVFSRFLKEKATRKNTAIIFGIAIIVFPILGGITSDTDAPISNKQNQQTQQNNKNTQKAKSQGEAVGYEIVESEDQSHKAFGNKLLSEFTSQELANLPTDKKILYRIVVSPEIKENQVEPTIEQIISDIISKDNDIDEISIFLYSDKELSNGAYDVATATWAPNGKLGNVDSKIAESNNRSSYKTTIQIKENLEEYLQQRGQAEEKFGFTEVERRQIFKEIVSAEDRARDEADQLYTMDISNPNYKQENLMKNLDKNRELSEKYKVEVRTKYGITKDQESEITVEALMENWPMD